MGSRASPTIASISHCTPVAHTGTSTTRKNQRENPLAAMTASNIPPHEQSDNTDNTEPRAHTPPEWWDQQRPNNSDDTQIGRGSGRERVNKYVKISVGDDK